MKGCAELVFEMDEPEMVYRALIPETQDRMARSSVDLALCENSIVLRIEGGDVSSLRAALNTWIRLVKIAFEMVNI
jgi:KEOPS complex subunit Pcc1